jgi:uncharacterized PurR-regulated membrane protein YhhQ (DUF165 family)
MDAPLKLAPRKAGKGVQASIFLGFLASIPAANWLVSHVAPVAVWPGILAPAGVLAAGAAFTLRDLLQRVASKRAVLLAVGAGVVASAALAGPVLAVASAAAFLASELLDFLVFTALARRGLAIAVTASNLVGAVVDSIIFLSLAFGSLAFLPGQIIGKMEMTALAVALLAVTRKAYAR